MKFSRRLIVAFTVFVSLGLGGCASEHMVDVAVPQVIAAKDPNTATMVFFRSSFFGGAIQSSVYDVSKGEASFIGILSAGKKIAYAAPPGKQRYMVVSESADFMDADTLPGKTYYVRVRPRLGVWRARFSMRPIPVSDAGLKEEVGSCQWVENTPASLAWAQGKTSTVAARQAKYLAKWLKSDNNESVRPGDGE
jgi:hypothetical protein